MWPMTPVVHMTYRLWQLGRGSLLVSVLEGPVWLIYLQVSCLLPNKKSGKGQGVRMAAGCATCANDIYAWHAMHLCCGDEAEPGGARAGVPGCAVGLQFRCSHGVDAMDVPLAPAARLGP